MMWASPLLAIMLTLAAGALLFASMGQDPLQGLRVFLWDPLSTRRGWSELGLKATPLILCAVGLAVCFRANVWNIGAEGQLIAGAIAGGGIALLATRRQHARTGACDPRWRPRSAVQPGRPLPRGCATASMRTRSWSA